MSRAKDVENGQPRKVTNVDLIVGMRIRQVRLSAGLSQTAVADVLGVTFQQIQKYERGANRISASTLHSLADYFKLPVGHFFLGAGNDEVMEEMCRDAALDFAFSKRGRALIGGFQGASPAVQNAILGLLRATADEVVSVGD